MKPTRIAQGLALAGAAVLSLYGCGGGGSATTAGTANFDISGLAATGAPMANAVIVVLDATGRQVQLCDPCKTDAQGRYTVQVRGDAKAAYVLKATPDGGGEPQVSVVAESRPINVNITPITTMISGRLASNGDPSSIDPAILDATKIAVAREEVVAAIRSLLDAAGVSSATDPLTAPFATDGRGMDRVLDSMNVQIKRNAATGQASIEVEVKLAGDGTQPPAITITPQMPPPVLPAISTANLIEDGSAPLMADFASRASLCYSLPQVDRVTDGTNVGSSMKAAVCKGLFLDGNPAQYLHNGGRVGFGVFPNSHYSGIWRNTATVEFFNPVYIGTRDNGDVIFGMDWRASNGNTGNSVQVVRKSAAGKFEVVGNQYQYDAFIRPFAQKRTYLESTSAAMNHHSTGFNAWVRNETLGGTPIFSQVLVTAPNGRTLKLVPTTGRDSLVIEGTNTSVVRLQWQYDATGSHLSANGTSMAAVETSLAYSKTDGVASPWTDDSVRSIRNSGKWKYEFYLASDPAVVAATQWYTTRERPATVSEFKAVPKLNYASHTIASLVAGIGSNTGGSSLTTQPQFDWELEQGASPATWVNIFVRRYNDTPPANSTLYQDSVSPASTERSRSIPCSRQTSDDVHCDAAVAVGASGPHQTSGGFITSTGVGSRDSRDHEREHHYALYRRNANP